MQEEYINKKLCCGTVTHKSPLNASLHRILNNLISFFPQAILLLYQEEVLLLVYHYIVNNINKALNIYNISVHYLLRRFSEVPEPISIGEILTKQLEFGCWTARKVIKMTIGYNVVWLLLAVQIVNNVSAGPAVTTDDDRRSNIHGPDSCTPTVIAHRGASGYVPEHTLGSYALAITMGTDYVEPDLVMTKDGHLIARHDNELGLTTDVAEHPEFADRHRTQTIDGNIITGWFTEDFTLAEIKSLRAIERIPAIRPGNSRMNGAFDIPTFQEIIDLVKSLQISQRRTIGIYPEIKHSTHFQRLGLPMENLVVNTFHINGYHGATAPVYIQSFEVDNLKELNKITNLRLLQLYDEKSIQPFDQSTLGTNLTYGEMATSKGLSKVAEYADAVGPDKSYIIPRNADNSLGIATNFVTDAHAVGLKVHPYTFRAENSFLPKEYQSSDSSEAALGDLSGEIRAFLAAGIDGLFSDQPNIAVNLKQSCLKKEAVMQ